MRRIARHLQARLPANVETDDLLQAGLLGLLEAAGRFVPREDTPFEAYACRRIRGAMLDELRTGDWMPRSARRTRRLIDAAVSRLEQRHGRAPAGKEVARELGVTLGRFQRMRDEASAGIIVSFEDCAEASGPVAAVAGGGVSGDPERLSRETHEEDRRREALVEAVGNLGKRDRMILGLYYEQGLLFRQIAGVLGVSESRVCQIHGRALERLRACLAAE